MRRQRQERKHCRNVSQTRTRGRQARRVAQFFPVTHDFFLSVASLFSAERESLRAKRKALADANARVAESETADYDRAASAGDQKKKKKARLEDGTGGPARASDDVKNKEQMKRGKGQSGIETGWKPEIWMQQRQNYDS